MILYPESFEAENCAVVRADAPWQGGLMLP